MASADEEVVGVQSPNPVDVSSVYVPPANVVPKGQTAHVPSLAKYQEMYRRSIEQPEEFWREV